MTVELITSYYREEFLAPLFMMHYEWVDYMTIITHRRHDNQFDDQDKSIWINQAIARSCADWVVVVDMDEFIYPLPYPQSPRQVLENTGGDMIFSQMWRCWRHNSEPDIDRMAPPYFQRMHGQKDHLKPAVFRPKGVSLGAGNHDAHRSTPFRYGKTWGGRHWANADASFWVTRETRDRGPRLTERNKSVGHGVHTLRSEQQILAECKAHENDPPIPE